MSLTAEQKAAFRAEKLRFWGFMKTKDKRLVSIERNQPWCICDIIFPSIWSHVRIFFRYILTGLVYFVPWSWPRILVWRFMGVKVGQNVWAAPCTFLDPFFPWLIELDDGAFLGIGSRILTHEYNVDDFRAGRVRVGKNTVLGAWSTIRCGVRLGDEVIVGMCSLVTKDAANRQKVVGVPALPLAAATADDKTA